MDKSEAINIVKRYKDAISEQYKPVAVYLYGSYSKGTQREDSDIDVAVVINKMQGDWFSNVPGLWKAGRQVNSLIEPVLIEESNPSPLYEDVLRNGIAV